jgi:hypothetical protein
MLGTEPIWWANGIWATVTLGKFFKIYDFFIICNIFSWMKTFSVLSLGTHRTREVLIHSWVSCACFVCDPNNIIVLSNFNLTSHWTILPVGSAFAVKK